MYENFKKVMGKECYFLYEWLLQDVFQVLVTVYVDTILI